MPYSSSQPGRCRGTVGRPGGRLANVCGFVLTPEQLTRGRCDDCHAEVTGAPRPRFVAPHAYPHGDVEFHLKRGLLSP